MDTKKIHKKNNMNDWVALASEMPSACDEARTKAMHRQNQLTKPPRSLGDLEDWTVFLAGWQRQVCCDSCTIHVYAGRHGVNCHGVSAYPDTVTRQMVVNFDNGGAAINQLALWTGAALRVHGLWLDETTADFTTRDAMTQARFCEAMQRGFDCVSPNDDVIALGEMGIGNTTAAAALCHALYGGEAKDWVGRGTGVKGDALHHKIELVARAVTYHEGQWNSPFDLLRRMGGYEMVAMAGGIIAARMARVPVILDGFICCAVAAVLQQWSPQALEHCLVGHQSAEKSHAKLLDKIGKKPMLNLNMALGEGSGAACALGLLKAAVACYRDMASFDQAQVDEEKGQESS